jgi:hypothetical protein
LTEGGCTVHCTVKAVTDTVYGHCRLCCGCHSNAIGHVKEVIWMTTIVLYWFSLVASDTAIQREGLLYIFILTRG